MSYSDFSAAGAKITVLVYSRAIKKIADRARMSAGLRNLLNSASSKIGDARFIGEASGIGLYRYDLTYDEVRGIVQVSKFFYKAPLPGLLTDEEFEVLRMCSDNLEKSLHGESGAASMRYHPKE